MINYLYSTNDILDFPEGMWAAFHNFHQFNKSPPVSIINKASSEMLKNRGRELYEKYPCPWSIPS